MRSGPKRKLKAVDALAREATKVGLGDCEDARALRSAARAARAWFAKVKRTGIERGEASISELRALLPEAAKIRVDISGDVDVVKQASLQVRPRRPFHFIQTTRVHLTMPGVVACSILSCFGPRRGRRGVSERQRSRRWRQETASAAVTPS